MPQVPLRWQSPAMQTWWKTPALKPAGLRVDDARPGDKGDTRRGHDPIQMDNGYTRTGYGSAKLTGSDKPVQAAPLSEDFSSGDLSAWSSDAFANTQFEIKDGALELGSAPLTASECRVLYTGENYQDAVYEATLEILNPNTSSQELGMVARYMSSESYIFFSYAPWRTGSGATYEIARRVGTSLPAPKCGAGHGGDGPRRGV